MSRIRVLTPGFQTTVQDLGRFGFAHLGVSASGAADAFALRAANRLVGNAETAAGLEMTLTGGEFEFESEAVVALAGSDFGANAPMWAPVRMAAGSVLRCGATRDGARCYLAVRGGIAVPRTMGSASVHLTTGVGGSALRRGDVLEVGAAAERDVPPSRQAATQNAAATQSPAGYLRPEVLRVTAGPQADWFSGELYRGEYRVAEESNRMGLRLVGPAIPSPPGHMLTEGTPLGAVQIPPGGQPIVLFVEHQTTGGYPKPANVISADFRRLGQLRPRDAVRFELVTLDRALALLREQEQWLDSL
ncbi:MAG TPA: biotin-dependent carboxyltransferase family protein [Bryobacteraceae bacterium]|nr:biotin-dependent carboxyltransferase family protein [Bryobacteraceae bacterium]